MESDGSYIFYFCSLDAETFQTSFGKLECRTTISNLRFSTAKV